MEELYDVQKEVHSALVPLRAHTIYWSTVAVLFFMAIIAHQLNAFNRFEIVWILLGTIVAVSASYVLMTSLLIKPIQEIRTLSAHDETSFRENKEEIVLRWSIYFSPLRHVLRLWQLYTDLPLRFLIESQRMLNKLQAKDAELKIYHRLGAWMHVLYSELQFTHTFNTLRIIGWISAFCVALFFSLTDENSGFALWYAVVTLILFSQARMTRILYHRMIYSMLLTISIGHTIEQKITSEKIFVYAGLKDTTQITLFDKPVVGLNSIKEVAHAYHPEHHIQQEQASITSEDSRVTYVSKHLKEGYPEHILEQALISAGTSHDVAEKIMAVAKQQG